VRVYMESTSRKKDFRVGKEEVGCLFVLLLSFLFLYGWFFSQPLYL